MRPRLAKAPGRKASYPPGLPFTCLAFFLGLCIPACRELPPVVPEGYPGSPAAPGWPPLAVYDADPFSPRNRWFHRQFGGRTPAGDILAAHADDPVSSLVAPTPTDLAEIEALLHGCEGAPSSASPQERERVGRLFFRADASAEAARIVVEWPESPGRTRIVELLSRLAGLPPAPIAGPLPPPLQKGSWEEQGPPNAPGLLPGARDHRGSRVFRSKVVGEGEGGGRGPRPADGTLLLLREPVVGCPPGPTGPLGLANECWEISRRNGEITRSVYRLDRAGLLLGVPAWRRVPPSEEISIRSPLDPRVILAGPLDQLCSSCHCGEQK